MSGIFGFHPDDNRVTVVTRREDFISAARACQPTLWDRSSEPGFAEREARIENYFRNKIVGSHAASLGNTLYLFEAYVRFNQQGERSVSSQKNPEQFLLDEGAELAQLLHDIRPQDKCILACLFWNLAAKRDHAHGQVISRTHNGEGTEWLSEQGKRLRAPRGFAFNIPEGFRHGSDPNNNKDGRFTFFIAPTY